jgi:hypothetical protein
MDANFQRLLRETAFSLRGLDASQTQFRPPSRPNKWSIQQIVEHLLLTYSGTETALNARLAKRTATQARPNLLQRISQYTVIRIGYFPTRRKAPPLVTPSATVHPLSGAELTQAAVDHITHLDLLCAEAGELFGVANPCATHMVLGPLSIEQWCKFQLIHGEHHLKQILAIRKAHKV